MNKQMTPAEIELARQTFARLAFGVEYNKGGSHDLCRSGTEKPPANLPVVQRTKFNMAVNFRTAKSLGIEVPSKLIDLSNEVID